MSTLRVSHVITKLALGGAQESALVTCEGLDPNRFRQVLFTGIESDDEGTMFAEAEQRGIRVELAPELVHRVRPASDLAAVSRLADRLASAGTQLVHTHSSKAGLVGRLAARRLRLPVVHSVHGWSFNDHQRPALRRGVVASERCAARYTDAIVVEASPDRAKGLDAGIGRAEQYRLIRNGIDLQSLSFDPEAGTRLRAELGIGPAAHLVGTVGRLADQKDPVSMVEMFAHLRASDLDVHFVWVGDGALREVTQAAVDRAGLGDRFHLLGVRRDVSEMLSAFDVFALSSLWEGLPRTVTEAMAVGIPVAATAVDGCAEIITDGEDGLLVTPSRPVELAGAVGRLLREPELATSVASRARVRVQEWDRTGMLEQIAALYDEVAMAHERGTGLGPVSTGAGGRRG
ncbi:MAG: glycosyltransferase [Actinobacteria bacterium]|nr:glycosyltransferase [Actinomycetota bacterium]